MIYDELKNLLVGVCMPIVVDTMDETIDIFDKYSVPAYMDVFERQIGTMPDAGADDIADTVINQAKHTLHYLIGLHGIKVWDDTSHIDLNAIADGLFTIADHEDKEGIFALINSDLPAPEIFAELMTYSTIKPVEYWLSRIEEVSESFILAFKSRLSEDIQAAPQQSVDFSEKVRVYRAFKTIVTQNVLADFFTINANTLDMPFDAYFKIFMEEKAQQIESMSVADISAELVAMAILSKDGHKNPYEALRSSMGKIYADTNATTKLDIQVKSLINQCSRVSA